MCRVAAISVCGRSLLASVSARRSSGESVRARAISAAQLLAGERLGHGVEVAAAGARR